MRGGELVTVNCLESLLVFLPRATDEKKRSWISLPTVKDSDFGLQVGTRLTAMLCFPRGSVLPSSSGTECFLNIFFVIVPFSQKEGWAQAEDCVVEVPRHHSVLHGLNCKGWRFVLGSPRVCFVSFSLSVARTLFPFSRLHRRVHHHDLTKIFLFPFSRPFPFLSSNTFLVSWVFSIIAPCIGMILWLSPLFLCCLCCCPMHSSFPLSSTTHSVSSVRTSVSFLVIHHFPLSGWIHLFVCILTLFFLFLFLRKTRACQIVAYYAI